MAPQDTPSPIERREHERLRLAPMYTRVLAEQPAAADGARLAGHLYDISRSGARLELDQPLPVGEPVSLALGLPGAANDIAAIAEVVWVNSAQDDPGPRRMAVRFTRFASQNDRDRLDGYLAGAAQAQGQA